MKTKGSTETVRAFFSMIIKKILAKKIWVEKGTEFAQQFKKLCKAERLQQYSTVSDTKAAFAEHTIRSLKKVDHCYMEAYGYEYNHNVTQFVTTLNYRRNFSTVLISKHAMTSDIWSFLYSKPLQKIRKPKIKIADTVRISKYDLPFSKGYKPQCS